MLKTSPPNPVSLHRLWERETTGAVHRESGQVVVSRPDLVKRVLTDAAGFAPDNALDAVTPIPYQALRILARQGFRLPATLANNGTDTHPQLRAIVASAMTPAQVAALRPWLTGLVRRRVAGLAQELRAGHPVDLHRDISADLPLLALGRLVALPAAEIEVVKEFSRAALELFWAPLEVDRQRRLATLVAEHHRSLRLFARTASGMVARLREHCADNGLGEDPVVAALFFLLVAGQETTSQFLTLLLHRLIGEGSVLDDLCRGVVSVDAVVEEGLRLEPPIVSWRRIATRDTQLEGVPVFAGDSVLLWLSQAGRQVAGTDFVPGRPGSRRHLAFGAGAHRCLGAQLARMEAAVVVAELAPLLRGVSVVDAPQCPDNLSFRMPDRLRISRSGPIRP